MADAAVLDAPPVAPPAASQPPAAPELDAVEWAANPRLTPKPAPSSEVPKAQEPAAVAPVVEGEPPTAEPKAAETPAKAEIPVDWKAKLEAGDPEFLKEFESHPKVKGFIAGRADFLAKQQREAEAKAAKDVVLDQAALANPDDPLAQERLEARQKETSAQNAQLASLTAFQAAQDGVAEFVASLSPETRAEIAKVAPAGKTYGEPGDLKSGLVGYMADVVKGALAAEVEKALEARFTAELPARFKDYLAEKGETEPSPDLGSGAPAGGTDLTAEKYAQMTPAELRKLTSTAAGRAQIDKMWASGVNAA